MRSRFRQCVDNLPAAHRTVAEFKGRLLYTVEGREGLYTQDGAPGGFFAKFVCQGVLRRLQLRRRQWS